MDQEIWKRLLDQANELRQKELHALADAAMAELERAVLLSELEDARVWTAGTLDAELGQ
jgi:hypothetical protein